MINDKNKGELRTAQVFKAGEWVDVPFREIEKGDTFRLFEADGTPCATASNCLALEAPKPTAKNKEVWGIEAIPVGPQTAVEEGSE